MSQAALKASRLDYAHERRKGRVRLPPGVRLRRLGRLAGLLVYVVDGELIRRCLDQDFTMGGNPSRYGYVPANEIWIDGDLSPVDGTATLLHELVEHQRMQGGEEYEVAHDAASAVENRLREKLAGQPLHHLNLRVVARALARSRT